MPTRADIIVSGEYDSDWQLVVEVKAEGDIPTAETQLRRYPQDSNCPLGLLVTPSDIRLFRDTYVSAGPDSITRVAVHPLPDELRPKTMTEVQFERAVQRWLERLAVSGTAIVEDNDLAATLGEYVVPVLREGNIGAGSPRWVREAQAE